MNKVQETILKELGLELEQEFEYNDDTFKFALSQNYLHLKFKHNNEWYYKDDFLYLIINEYNKIHPIKKSILDEAEKKYLEGVLMPFKNRVEYIRLNEGMKEVTFIEIRFNDHDCLVLPYFKKGTMYKGMELNKKYTLEELGFFVE